MGSTEYAKFVDHYRLLRLGSMEDDFVLAWRPKLDGFALPDLLGAVDDVAGDPRMGFPLNDLPLLIEHANERKSNRLRKERKPIRWEKNPPSTEAWDKKLLAIGGIRQKEFKARQASRKETA